MFTGPSPCPLPQSLLFLGREANHRSLAHEPILAQYPYFRNYVLVMFRRRRSADDFAEEIKSHFELEADELQSEGLSEEEARRRTRVEFGGAQAAQERFYL